MQCHPSGHVIWLLLPVSTKIKLCPICNFVTGVLGEEPGRWKPQQAALLPLSPAPQILDTPITDGEKQRKGRVRSGQWGEEQLFLQNYGRPPRGFGLKSWQGVDFIRRFCLLTTTTSHPLWLLLPQRRICPAGRSEGLSELCEISPGQRMPPSPGCRQAFLPFLILAWDAQRKC